MVVSSLLFCGFPFIGSLHNCLFTGACHQFKSSLGTYKQTYYLYTGFFIFVRTLGCSSLVAPPSGVAV